MRKILELKNIIKKFGQFYGLKGISLNIFEGEIIGLLGVNGAGKTTLSSVIATLHPPTSGNILFFEKSIYKDISAFRKYVGYCQQKANLNPSLSLYDNLWYAGRYYGLTHEEVEMRIKDLSQTFGLKNYLKDYPNTLSGGWKQRFMLARTLIHNPKIVILDEPTVALNPAIRHKLWRYIQEMKQLGVTIILTTHYIEEAEYLSDRVCVLDRGEIKLVDTPKNLMSSFNKGKLEDVFLQLTQETEEI